MGPSSILVSLFTIFATSPDLCAEVYLDVNGAPWTDAIGQTLPRYCQWTGPNPPVLNKEVCCEIDDEVAACVLPDVTGGCASGSLYSCTYGEITRTGVVCYQPFPDLCDSPGDCVQPPPELPPTQADLICCNGGTCQEIKIGQNGDCKDNGGILAWCDFGVSNEDGTVTCYDY